MTEKVDFSPPGLMATGNSCWIMPRPEFTSDSEVLNSVAAGYRYRHRLRLAVRKDLLRWASAHSVSVYMDVFDGKPYPAFPSSMVADWLSAGGVTFIITELEKNSARRVVAFPWRRA
jgi:hypothetical protein